MTSRIAVSASHVLLHGRTADKHRVCPGGVYERRHGTNRRCTHRVRIRNGSATHLRAGTRSASLAAGMEALRVPGVNVAGIRNGEVEWPRGFGHRAARYRGRDWHRVFRSSCRTPCPADPTRDHRENRAGHASARIRSSRHRLSARRADKRFAPRTTFTASGGTARTTTVFHANGKSATAEGTRTLSSGSSYSRTTPTIGDIP